jgi:hypothetical protein
MSEDDHLKAIDAAVIAAQHLFALDIEDEEEREQMWEWLYHCEVCTVREVLTVIWPPVLAYIDWLKSQVPVP